MGLGSFGKKYCSRATDGVAKLPTGYSLARANAARSGSDWKDWGERAEVAVTGAGWLVGLLAWTGYGQVAPPQVREFGEVAHGAIYRGGQPTDAELAELAGFGIVTVIDLRGDRTVAHEKAAVESLHMQFVHVPLKELAAPTGAEIGKLMTLLETAPRPIFLHCHYGRDRTGTVVACWRIAHDHWPNGKALREAKAYHLNWVEFGMKRFIAKYVAGK